MSAWLYILASQPGGTLYVGVTNDLIRRVAEHRGGNAESFTKRYDVKMLVYYERHETVPLAIQREKNIKHWRREWKIDFDSFPESELARSLSGHKFLTVIARDRSEISSFSNDDG